MRRRSPRLALTVLGTLLLGRVLLLAGEFDAWNSLAEVTAPDKPFVSFRLTPELFDAAEKPDLSDLRLADAEGVEVPYAVIRELERREEKELVGRELNRDNPAPDQSRITIDFRTSVVKNRITVRTTGDNFRRRARVEGSTDQESWAEVLKEGWLFAVGRERSARFESLDLGENTYRYLRVWVEKMPSEAEPPRIDSVTCRHVVVVRPEEIRFRAKLESYTHDAEAQTSTALLDLERRHLPVVRLELSLASDPQRVFRRDCRVWGRNSLEHIERIRFETNELGEERVVETRWSLAGSGTVYRDAAGKESLDLRVPTPYRYVKIVVENRDSPPLDLGRVDAVMHPVHVVFEPAGGKDFTVYAGNGAAAPPRYEARGTLQSLDVRKLPEAKLGALTAQHGARPAPTEGGQTAVWILMALAVFATAALLWYTASARGRGEGTTPEPAS